MIHAPQVSKLLRKRRQHKLVFKLSNALRINLLRATSLIQLALQALSLGCVSFWRVQIERALGKED